jgi:hypothetical protein
MFCRREIKPSTCELMGRRQTGQRRSWHVLLRESGCACPAQAKEPLRMKFQHACFQAPKQICTEIHTHAHAHAHLQTHRPHTCTYAHTRACAHPQRRTYAPHNKGFLSIQPMLRSLPAESSTIRYTPHHVSLLSVKPVLQMFPPECSNIIHARGTQGGSESPHLRSRGCQGSDALFSSLLQIFQCALGAEHLLTSQASAIQ